MSNLILTLVYRLPPFVTLEASAEDITAYITHKLAMDTKVKMEDDFKNQIVTEIVSTSQGMLVTPLIS
jgi:hypothetical protein